MSRFVHGSQAPADCKVYGQETRAFLLRPLVLQALVVGVIGCAVILAVMAVMP